MFLGAVHFCPFSVFSPEVANSSGSGDTGSCAEATAIRFHQHHITGRVSLYKNSTYSQRFLRIILTISTLIIILNNMYEFVNINICKL